MMSRKGYAKIDTFATFYESFLEIKYFTSSMLKSFKGGNENPRALGLKVQFWKL